MEEIKSGLILGDLIDAPIENKDETLNLQAYDPKFEEHENLTAELFVKVNCRKCKNRVSKGATLDGLCLPCAQKSLRELELGLIRFKVLKEGRKYCCLPGHGTLPKDVPDHKDWSGELVINGVHLYPVEPLCKECIDTVTAWLVYFLEERGFLRKGSGHTDNKFGTPYKEPLGSLVREEALLRLKDFMLAIGVYTANKEDPLHDLYSELKDRRKTILLSEKKSAEKDKEKHVNENKEEI